MSPPILPELTRGVAELSTNPEGAIALLRPLYAERMTYQNPIETLSAREPFLGLLRHMATRFAPFSMHIDQGVETEQFLYGRFFLAFRPGFLGRGLEIEGVTRCRLVDGQIVEQRDYYDLVSHALDAVPLAGPAFRKIIAKFRHGD